MDAGSIPAASTVKCYHYLMIKIFLLTSLFIFHQVLCANDPIEGNWIGASNPETIIRLSSSTTGFKGYEIDFGTKEIEDVHAFSINLSKTISESPAGKSDLILEKEDTLINSDGQILYRDYTNTQNKMMCMTDWSSKVPESIVKRLDSLRITAERHCLKCAQGNCAMKIWPEGKEKETLLCKRIFCQPVSSIKKNILAELDKFPSGTNSALFNYSINENGTIDNLEVYEIIGSMNKKQASLYLNEMLKSHRYKTIVVKGRNTGIDNLGGAINWTLERR